MKLSICGETAQLSITNLLIRIRKHRKSVGHCYDTKYHAAAITKASTVFNVSACLCVPTNRKVLETYAVVRTIT